MREQNYVHRAIVSPAGIFKCPMEVVEADGIQLLEKIAILKGRPMNGRFCAPKTKA
jgi:hypothetical protein